MKEIIIPGLVRSGTSYLATRLQSAGIAPHRPLDGHMEDTDVYGWNRREHAANPRDWTNPHDWRVTPETDHALKDHRKMLRNRGRDYFVKEPQIWQHLPAYTHVWHDALWVVCVRNPLASTWSHRRAGQWQNWNDDTTRLWLYAAQMQYAAQEFSNVGARVFWWCYDADQEREQERLSEFLGVEVDLVKHWEWSGGRSV